MAADARSIGVSWRLRVRAAAVSRAVRPRSVRSRPRRGRRRPSGFAPAATVPELTVWTLDRETVQAALEHDWQ